MFLAPADPLEWLMFKSQIATMMLNQFSGGRTGPLFGHASDRKTMEQTRREASKFPRPMALNLANVIPLVTPHLPQKCEYSILANRLSDIHSDPHDSHPEGIQQSKNDST